MQWFMTSNCSLFLFYLYMYCILFITETTAEAAAQAATKSATNTNVTDRPVDISRLDIRVGRVVSVEKVNHHFIRCCSTHTYG